MRDKKWAVQTVLGSRVQFLLEVVFFVEFICSNTILADLPEWSTLGKTRVSVSICRECCLLRYSNKVIVTNLNLWNTNLNLWNKKDTNFVYCGFNCEDFCVRSTYLQHSISCAFSFGTDLSKRPWNLKNCNFNTPLNCHRNKIYF